MTKIQALAKYLELSDTEEEDIEQVDYMKSGYSYGDKEYLVLTDKEADEQVAEYIKDSIWSFNASYILEECNLDNGLEEAIQAYQQKECEGANDSLLSLVEKLCGLEQFIEDAIGADGRGHFLAGYDGGEIEEGEYYIYRTN